MKTRAAKFVVMIIATILSSANLLAAPENAEQAGDKCLTGPGDNTPTGSRWRYRLERGTGRQCWYLKNDSEKAARKASEDSTAIEEPATPSAPSRKKAAAPRAVSDAHAELPQTPPEQNAKAAPAPRAPASSSILAPTQGINMLAPASGTRWPDQPATTGASALPPAEPANQAAEAQPSATPPPQAMPRAVPPMPASEKPLSLPMLITIIAGGLSVAGVIMSMFFGWRASRTPQLSRTVPMPPLELPDQPRTASGAARRHARMRAPQDNRDAA